MAGAPARAAAALPELLAALPARRRAWRACPRWNGQAPTHGRAFMQAQQPVRHWSDIAWFLFFSAVLGLTCGVALGGVALLLASPAYAADRAPEPAREASLLLRTQGSEETLSAPLVSTDVVFQVSGPIARARVIQTFQNPQAEWYEGVYVFPLP